MPDDHAPRDGAEGSVPHTRNDIGLMASTLTRTLHDDSIEKEINEIEYQTLVSEHCHFLAAGAWNCWFVVLGLFAALLGALTTGSALEGVKLIEGRQSMVTGGLALLLTLVSATIGFLDPKGQRDRHAETAKDYAQLRIDVRLSRCPAPGPSAVGTLEAQGLATRLCDLARQLAKLRTDAPLVSNWVHRNAKKRLKSNVHYRSLREMTGRSLRDEGKA